MLKSIIGTACAALILAGCAHSTSGQDGVDGADGMTTSRALTDPADLTGTWQIQSINGAPLVTPSDRGPGAQPATIRFQDGNLSAYVYCNQIGGDYIASPGTVKTGTVMSTLMACNEGMEQEAATNNILRKLDRFEITSDGMLILISSEGLTLEAVR